VTGPRPEPFVPRRGLAQGDLMTLAAWLRRRAFPGLPDPEARTIRVAADTQVLADCYWQPEPAARPTLVALHGLEGSSRVHYMRGLADKAWQRGWNAVLLNQRSCGGTENLTPGLYHSGLTADPIAVIRQLVAEKGLRDVGVIGYSLGGNLTLKLAAELGGHAGLPVRAVAAICPTIDLDRCVRSIERVRNLPYHFNFVRNLKARMRRRDRFWPGTLDLAPLGSIWTIRKFDDVYTAPYHGFGDARNYYACASALRVIDRVAIPALILAAEDDSFVPAGQFDEPAVRDNPWIEVRRSRHGGHCGFIAPPGQGDGYWAEAAAVAFLAGVMRG
jgi:predicted alpha/beta-fold hydrolase